MFSRATALESARVLKGPRRSAPKAAKTLPSGHSEPRNWLGRLPFLLSPPITQRQEEGLVCAGSPGQGALHLARSCAKLRDAGSHDGAAILPRPFYDAVLPPRGAQPTRRPPTLQLHRMPRRAPTSSNSLEPSDNSQSPARPATEG